ncbi:hypothetical protein BJV82DRAFT_597905 [Fennellomyces sp. T-0311]|nr:hypothetical protein BJV82DRAFT_597905 [Fennellomyces sp. T-0311]
MIHKVGVLGVQSLHAKNSPIGSITEVDHFQRVTVENSLATFIRQAYVVPMNNCEDDEYTKYTSAAAKKSAGTTISVIPEHMSTGLSAPPLAMLTISTRMNASVTMERQPSMMSEEQDKCNIKSYIFITNRFSLVLQNPLLVMGALPVNMHPLLRSLCLLINRDHLVMSTSVTGKSVSWTPLRYHHHHRYHHHRYHCNRNHSNNCLGGQVSWLMCPTDLRQETFRPGL